MLASCSMYVLSRAGSLPPPTCSLHSCACRYLLSTTANTTQRRRAIIMRLSGSSSESCRCSHHAAAAPPPLRRASLHLRAPPSTLTVEYKRRRNFSDFVRSSLLLPTLLLSSIVHANMHATTRRDKASLCSSLFASSRTVCRLLCQLKSLNAMQPTNGLSPKKEEEEKKGTREKPVRSTPAVVKQRGKNLRTKKRPARYLDRNYVFFFFLSLGTELMMCFTKTGFVCIECRHTYVKLGSEA